MNTEHERQQQHIWNNVATGWDTWQHVFERGAATASAHLVQQAAVRPGDTVVDFATGLGEPAFTAAHAVGPTGRVIAVDLSTEMIARARGKGTNLSNIEFHATTLGQAGLQPSSVDAVLSRWGLSFVEDPADILRQLHRLLRSGGRFAAATWCSPEQVPMISLAFQTISSVLELPPPPPSPGPFAMADQNSIHDHFEQAGFADIAISTLEVPFVVDSASEFAQFSRDVLPPGMRAVVIDRLGDLNAPRVWDAVCERAARYAAHDGRVHLTSHTNIVTARKLADAF